MPTRRTWQFLQLSSSLLGLPGRDDTKRSFLLGLVLVGIRFSCLNLLFGSKTMAPDADKIRQRKAQQQIIGAKGDDDAAELKIGTLKGLAGTEVVIDGVIYDIADFDHPGGESVLLFGGNDVTATYKMIHPYHTTKHLEKMKKVGHVPDYHSE